MSVLNIGTCTDRRGFGSLWVLTQSLLASQADETEINIVVLHDGLSNRQICALTEAGKVRERTNIEFHLVDLNERFSGGGPHSVMTYARFLLPEYFKSTLLYLDTDIVVKDDLSHLMRLPLSVPIGAVEAQTVGDSNCRLFFSKKRVDASTPYFNAGVLLMDGRQWLSSDIFGELVKIGEQEKWDFPTFDQTLLNYYFQGSFVRLSKKYNTLAYASAECDMNEVIENAAIVHFISRPKPWEIFGSVNLNFALYKRVVDIQSAKRAPFSIYDIPYSVKRVEGYLPSYVKCARARYFTSTS